MLNHENQAGNAWKVLALLLLANLINFYDRAIPAVIGEPIRHEWGLNDLQLALVYSAFTVVYAVAGLPLGRWADTGSRKQIMGWGLVAWSTLTGATALAWSYLSFLLIRIGAGVGEASYAPAATSMIGDLFPSSKRSRAIGIFMLGLPIGLVLAFFTVGAITKAFGSWRAPFVMAAAPGIVLAIFMFIIREPVRGAAEDSKVVQAPVARPIRHVLRIPTMRWIIAAGITGNFAAYAANAFLVPLLQRHFKLPLEQAAIFTGVIVGVTGLIGLTLGGWIADKLNEKTATGRLVFGAISLAVAAVATWYALSLGSTEVSLFVALFAFGWLLQYNVYTCVYPAIQDVVEPRLRATAMAIYLAVLCVAGGALGPLVVGALSDRYAEAAMAAAGASQMTEQFKAIGLHDALYLIPATLLLTGIAMAISSRSFVRDHEAMKRDMTGVNVKVLAKTVGAEAQDRRPAGLVPLS